jgi:hypothetical protein
MTRLYDWLVTHLGCCCIVIPLACAALVAAPIGWALWQMS